MSLILLLFFHGFSIEFTAGGHGAACRAEEGLGGVAAEGGPEEIDASKAFERHWEGVLTLFDSEVQRESMKFQ